MRSSARSMFSSEIGVREPDITFAEHAEIRSADQRHAGVLQKGGCQLLGLPACA